MSRDEDGVTRDPKRASIPAPATVPRPSRPPSGLPPASARKGTLDGLSPPAVGFVYGAEPTTDDFDVERTVVVDSHDHDDGPTADYDPRMVTYDPRARGVFTPAAETRTRADTSPSAADRPSEAGRKRSSRRTVKMDRPSKPSNGSHDDADTPSSTESPELLTPRLPDVVEAVTGPATEAAPPPSDAAAQRPIDNDYDDYSDAIADEITIVRALRIINVGSEPPPPISSPEATWPPPADASALDTGWTPIAPGVVERPVAASEILPPAISDAPALSVPMASQALPTTERQPSVPDILVTEETPIADLRSDAGEAAQIAPGTADVAPLVADDERADLIEDIEPDSMPLPEQRSDAPKKPPPPPPKTKSETARAVTEVPRSKGKPWWEDIFSEEYLRTHDAPDELTVQREVNFIEESLGMEKHAVVLDLACGAGDHTIEFALRGYNVVGFDYSAGQLGLAEKRLKTRTKGMREPSVPTFVQGDMRELPYEEAFDGVFCWSTSFGYFDEEKNLAVLQNVHRSLKQGGMFLLDVVNRDYVAPRAPGLVWFEGDRCVCMDDTHLDFFTSRLRVKRTAMFEGGLSRELDYSIRLYTLHELGKMLHEAGFKVIEVTGLPAHPGVFFGAESPRIIILAERA